MPLALLALRLLLTTPGDCYVVTNTRILILPTCDVSPDTIDGLTEDPRPSRASSGRTRTAPWAGRGRRPPPPVAPLGAKELESRLDQEQQRRITEVGRRVAAERERDAAIRERDAALRKLAELASKARGASGRDVADASAR